MITSGTWVRRGSTIVVDLGNAGAAELEFELEYETSQPTVRNGSTGSAVTTLQSRLKAVGFNPGVIDGIFGANTESAVRAFQSARHLTVDGIVGPQTWGALDASAAPPPPPPPPPPSTSPGTGYGRGSVHVNVPFRGYQDNDRAGCFRRCQEMAAAVGTTVGGSDIRIQVATREDTSGRVTVDPAAARQGIAYIDSQLNAGHPVCVGVSYKDDSYNVDYITDHFVLITTRGTDSQERTFYAFHDPARSSESYGGDSKSWNRFYPSSDGGLSRPPNANAGLGSYTYYLSMVRRNA